MADPVKRDVTAKAWVAVNGLFEKSFRRIEALEAKVKQLERAVDLDARLARLEAALLEEKKSSS